MRWALLLLLLATVGCGGKRVSVQPPAAPPATIPSVPAEVLAIVGTPRSVVALPVPADPVTHGLPGPGFWVYRDRVIGIPPDDPRCVPGVFDLGGNIIMRTDVCWVTLAVEAHYSTEGVDLVLLYLP